MFDGRGFEGVRLPLAATSGAIAFQGRRVWLWEEPPGSGSAGTRRMLVEGDVRAVLGRHSFGAERAVVWLQRLPEAGEGVYQVYALLEGLESLEGDAAVSIRADRLPVQGVIALDEPISIRTDLPRQGRPTGGDAAALVESDEMPPELLVRLKAVERVFGRRRGRRWDSRVIDLDIILWSGGAWASPGLIVPHPQFRRRDFVLRPLNAIVPGWRDPVTGRTIRQLAAQT